MGANDLSMYRGDDRSFTMTMTVADAPLDLTGGTVRFTARAKPSAVPVIELDSAVGGVDIVTPAAGVVQVNIPAAATEALAKDVRLLWDLEAEIGGSKRTFPESDGVPTPGTLTIKADYTHA